MGRFLSAAMAALVCVGAAAQSGPQPFGVPGHGNLMLNVPQGWRVSTQGVTDPPSAVVRIRPETGDAFILQVTAVWAEPARLVTFTPEGIRSRVEASSKKMLPSSVETEAPLTELRGKEAIGYHYSLTDAKSANAGSDYKYITSGAARIGELLVIFALVHREPEIAAKEQALRMLADAEHSRTPTVASGPRPDALQIAAVGTNYELSVPVSKLMMSVPKGQLVQAPGGDRSHPRYFYFVDGALNVSGWFEPAAKFRGMKDFWEAETRAWQQRGLPEPKNVAFAKIGNWDAVLYDHDLPTGAASNSHIRAHWIQSGTWIDLHLSLTAPVPAAESRQRVQAFLESIQVKEKP